jgi:thiosulfate/3-mercaptopyruvate sulfurtransferase
MTDRRELVDTAELRTLLSSDDPPALIDVRWTLAGGGRAGYDAGHLPGAVFLDLDADLAGPPGPGGRHPLPDPATLQATLRHAGVRAGRPVVVYDAGGSPPTGAAARAWWTLRWAGMPDVRVLDGGYAAWTGPVSRDEPRPAPGDVTLTPGRLPVLDADTLTGVDVLLDARVPARFRGEVEPVDPVAGHIPGAINHPAGETVDATGRLRTPAELKTQFQNLGVPAGGSVGAYCGSGVTAAQLALALSVAGFDAALYVGSWSHWITDPARPVATTEG